MVRMDIKRYTYCCAAYNNKDISYKKFAWFLCKCKENKSFKKENCSEKLTYFRMCVNLYVNIIGQNEIVVFGFM